jgi:hypothetical protein
MIRNILIFQFLIIIQCSCNKEENEVKVPTEPFYVTQFEPVIESISRNSNSEKQFQMEEYSFIGGYTQLHNNQDAYVICEKNGQIIWSKYFDRSLDDSKVSGIIAGGNDLFVAFSCTGGNTDFDATPGAFQTSYGSGGGAKIVYLSRIEALSGGILNATFIGCKLNNGNTNTLRVEDENPQPLIINADGTLTFRATKAYDRADGRLTPDIGPDDDCLVSGGRWVGVFDRDLSLISGDCLP